MTYSTRCALTIGNGRILANLNKFGLICDLNFPSDGLKNQLDYAQVLSIGVVASSLGDVTTGNPSWLDDGTWQIQIACESNALISDIVAYNPKLGVRLRFSDCCDIEASIIVRKITIVNDFNSERQIKIFFRQRFESGFTTATPSGYYDPLNKALIYYDSKRAFLVNTALNGQPLRETDCDQLTVVCADQYAEHDEKILYYWLMSGISVREVIALNNQLLKQGPQKTLDSTRDYWKSWLDRQPLKFERLDPGIIALFRKSLMLIKVSTDYRGGGVVAACNMTIRDACIAALVLMKAGDHLVAKRFFEYCGQTITNRGYFMPGKFLNEATSIQQLPFMEDETATVLWSLWEYYDQVHDFDFVETVYNSLIKPAADFLVWYRNRETGLPRPSWDFWGERLGVHNYTCGSVYGGLEAAARFSKLQGRLKDEQIYRAIAEEIGASLKTQFYNQKTNAFVRSFTSINGIQNIDDKSDISTVIGLVRFGIIEKVDIDLHISLERIIDDLKSRQTPGGMTRYPDDNIWLVSSLWWAPYLLSQVKKPKDLEAVEALLLWVRRQGNAAGTLADQLNPLTVEQAEIVPSVLTHAEFAWTVSLYLDKLAELGLSHH